MDETLNQTPTTQEVDVPKGEGNRNSRWSVPRLFLLVPLFYSFHIVEEYIGFPEWSTLHFGITTRGFFVLSNIFLFATVLGVSLYASRTKKRGLGAFLGLGTQVVFLINVVFHVCAGLWFGDYSPGTITGVIIWVPFSFYLFKRVLEDGYLTRKQFAWSFLLGTLVQIGVVASLFQDMDMV